MQEIEEHRVDGRGDDMVAIGRRWSRLAQGADRSEMGSMLSDDFVMWYNFNGSERGKADFIATLHSARAVFPDQHHSNEHITATTAGFVLQATMHGTMNGTTLAANFCLVCRVRDGLIYRADEYFDTRQLPLVAADASSEMISSPA
ncbi:MAG: nuclear transport factor 2 family protein [Janthinobacterium lividum]